METFWKWIERITWIVAIILFVMSILKRWWGMNDIKLFWNNLSPGKLMLYIIIILILISFIVRLFRLIKLGIPRSFKAKLGFYWDKEFNPYCPVCKTLLSGANYSNILRCPKCDKEFTLRHGSKLYPLEDAVRAIKNKEI
jgi:uncharacterized membrane protein YwzB/ribosomal protein L37AE/L43A